MVTEMFTALAPFMSPIFAELGAAAVKIPRAPVSNIEMPTPEARATQ
jgi:hypothetical protein